MAGFSKEEIYFLSRMFLELPNAREALCHALLPQLETWRNQSKCPGGDHSECANNFLYEVIPYLIEVLIQDGIYFIVDFPNHLVSQILKSLPRYETWAGQARERCKEISINREVDKIEWLKARIEDGP
jgi:hypothetical protein